MSDVARRSGRLAVAGLAAALGLGLPAVAAGAATAGYTPSSHEWWMANWRVPQQVWPLTAGAGVTVGVVDTGVQASIPDLRGVVLPGGDTLNGHGNGEKDYATAQNGHGTAVAVLISGQGHGTGTVGIAPKAKILPVHTSAPTTGVLSVAAGIKYAVRHGASVINVSAAAAPAPAPTSCDHTMQDAVAYAVAHNVVVVAASGDVNEGASGPQEPASCPGVLAVGAVEPDGSLWKYSTQGANVSVAAPGDHMVYVGMNGEYSLGGEGTSFSAPLVAGAAALIRSRYPKMPWYQVDQRIIATAIGVRPVPNNGYGYGIMDVAKAVNASANPVPASAPNPPYARYLAWLKSADGQAWAKANGVTVPSSGKSGSAGGAGLTAPSAKAEPSSGGSVTLIVVIAVVVVVVIALLALLLARARSRATRDFRGPR